MYRVNNNRCLFNLWHVSCHYPKIVFPCDISCRRSILVSDRYRVFVGLHFSHKFLEWLFFFSFLFLHFVTSWVLFLFLILSLFLFLSFHKIAPNKSFWQFWFSGSLMKTRSVLASSRTPLHSNSASIRIVTLKEPLFAYRYIYIHLHQCASLMIIYCFVF